MAKTKTWEEKDRIESEKYIAMSKSELKVEIAKMTMYEYAKLLNLAYAYEFANKVLDCT